MKNTKEAIWFGIVLQILSRIDINRVRVTWNIVDVTRVCKQMTSVPANHCIDIEFLYSCQNKRSMIRYKLWDIIVTVRQIKITGMMVNYSPATTAELIETWVWESIIRIFIFICYKLCCTSRHAMPNLRYLSVRYNQYYVDCKYICKWQELFKIYLYD